MEKALIKLVVAFIWWELFRGLEKEDKYRQRLMDLLFNVERDYNLESEG